MDHLNSLVKKVLNNWEYYKKIYHNKKFIFIRYLFWVWIYHNIFCQLLAIPLAIIYFVIYPVIKFRFTRLASSAIGHFSATTELFLCELDNLPDDKFVNVFYLENGLYTPRICNIHLYRMWKRIIFILPSACPDVFYFLDKIIMRFLHDTAYDLHGLKSIHDNRHCVDMQNHLQTKPAHLQFTENEKAVAKNALQQINLTPSDRYICLYVRSGAYHKGHPVWDYPERDADIASYKTGALFLAEKGFYVLRMGKSVDDYIEWNHPRIIDYSRSAVQSDLMDIYLPAHCYFFMTTTSGLDGVAQIFRVPIVYTNAIVTPPVAFYPYFLGIFKLFFFKDTNTLLSIHELMHYFHLSEDIRAEIGFHITSYLEKMGIGYRNNSEDEILSIIEEALSRMENTWQETEYDIFLQKKFWKIYLDLVDTELLKKTHAHRFVKIGAKFLLKYQDIVLNSTPDFKHRKSLLQKTEEFSQNGYQ